MSEIKGIIFNLNGVLIDRRANKLIEGSLELLEDLRKAKIRLCLITCPKWRDRHPMKKIRALDLRDYFIEVFADKDKLPDILSWCSDAMHLPYNQIMVVDDRVNKIIREGKQMGMTALWYQVGKFATRYPLNVEEQPHYAVVNHSGIYARIIIHNEQRGQPE